MNAHIPHILCSGCAIWWYVFCAVINNVSKEEFKHERREEVQHEAKDPSRTQTKDTEVMRQLYETDDIHIRTECWKQMSDRSRAFIRFYIIWQRIVKMEGDNSCQCSTSGHMNPVCKVRIQVWHTHIYYNILSFSFYSYGSSSFNFFSTFIF